MDEQIRRKILTLLEQHRIMTIATLRPDGWPQATTEAQKALRLLMLKYPQQASMPLPMPSPADVRVFRVTPVVVSVLDYTKGFAHTDLVSA